MSTSQNKIIVGTSDFSKIIIFEKQLDDSWLEKEITLPNPIKCSWNSVSISGDIAVVGDYSDNTNGTNSGCFYLLNREIDGTWSQTKITEIDGKQNNYFGISVSISGDRVIIGSLLGDGIVANSGTAYIYEKQSDNSWNSLKLFATDGKESDYYGCSVDILGDRAIVGATGTDDNGNTSGSVYIYKRNSDGNWNETKFIGSDIRESDLFGSSVGLSNDNFIVGAQYFSFDVPSDGSGNAYIYEW